MQILDTGLVVQSRPKTDGASCCFPSLCVLETGRWLVGYRLGPAKLSRTQRAFVSWSDDQGKTWSESVEPVARVPEVNGQPGTWRTIACTALGGPRVVATIGREEATDPLLPMFNEQTEGLKDMKLFTMVSEDAGESFSSPRPVDCGKYRDVPTPGTGPLLVMPDGRWAVQFEVNKHYDDPAPWQHASAMVFSSNHGRDWNEVVDVHTDPQRRMICWDQRLALAGKKVVALFWTFDRPASTYLNIHCRVSHDSGRTFGELIDTSVPGQPARLAAIDERHWVMVLADRTTTPTIVARLSTDAGQTWPKENMLRLHDRSLNNQTWKKTSMQDAWAEMSAFSIGLPDAVPLQDGSILAVYYTGQHPDYTDIHWTRFRI